MHLLNQNKYYCSYNNKKVLISSIIRHLNEQCGITSRHVVHNKSQNAIIVTLSIVCITIIISAFVTYFCRWKLRWKLYKLKRVVNRHRQDLNSDQLVEVDELYMYHAYVASHDEDIQWVINHLIPKVENEWGLQLMVRLRDFPAGGAIADNIVEAIDRSEKTLLILSNAFLRSKWGDFEVQMAVTKDYNTIIPCVMEDLNPKLVSSVLKRLLKSNSFVEWTGDHDGQALFWYKLSQLLINGHVIT